MDDTFARIEEYTSKLTADPGSLIFLPLAELYHKAGMADEAMDVCKKGIDAHPDYYSARVLLARLFLEKEKFAESRSELDLVLSREPNNLPANNVLALLLEKQGNSGESETLRKKISFLKGESSDQAEESEALTTATVAEIYFKQGLFDEAIRVYRKILETDPENAKIKKRLEEITAIKKSGEDKRKEVKAAVDQKPDVKDIRKAEPGAEKTRSELRKLIADTEHLLESLKKLEKEI